MLAGEVFFYNENEKIIETMDVEDYDGMSKTEVTEFLEKINCFKAEIHGFYHNFQTTPRIEVIYEKLKVNI